jgi:hypothetical protein
MPVPTLATLTCSWLCIIPDVCANGARTVRGAVYGELAPNPKSCSSGAVLEMQRRVTMLNDCLTRMVDDLAREGIPEPLLQSFTLATVWYDLCIVAGEEPPLFIRTLIGDDAPRPHRAEQEISVKMVCEGQVRGRSGVR